MRSPMETGVNPMRSSDAISASMKPPSGPMTSVTGSRTLRGHSSRACGCADAAVRDADGERLPCRGAMNVAYVREAAAGQAHARIGDEVVVEEKDQVHGHCNDNPVRMSVQPDRKWEAFAEREPFFAVFTDPKFLSANRTANQEREFFDSGELLVDSIFHTIRKRLTSDFAPESVLEYGCGPGRLAIPFARRTGSVTAVDRSPAMLAVARREAAKQNAGNIHFKTATEFAASPRKFDLVNSYLLFQRLPPDRGLGLVRELLGRIGS